MTYLRRTTDEWIEWEAKAVEFCGEVADLLAGLQADTKKSELCRREGITAAQYYQWRDRLMNSAGSVFARKPSCLSAEETATEAELRQLKDVIAEITAENLELKKTL